MRQIQPVKMVVLVAAAVLMTLRLRVVAATRLAHPPAKAITAETELEAQTTALVAAAALLHLVAMEPPVYQQPAATAALVRHRLFLAAA
jgi:hypothetical protein